MYSVLFAAGHKGTVSTADEAVEDSVEEAVVDVEVVEELALSDVLESSDADVEFIDADEELPLAACEASVVCEVEVVCNVVLVALVVEAAVVPLLSKSGQPPPGSHGSTEQQPVKPF